MLAVNGSMVTVVCHCMSLSLF